MLKNWIDFLTILAWMVSVLIYLPLAIRNDAKDFGYYTTWLIYLVIAIGAVNMTLTRAAPLIS